MSAYDPRCGRATVCGKELLVVTEDRVESSRLRFNHGISQDRNSKSHLMLDRLYMGYLQITSPILSLYLNPCHHLHRHAIESPPHRVTEDLQDEERHPHGALPNGDVATRCEDSKLEHHPLQARKLSKDSAATMNNFFHFREAAVARLFGGFLLRGPFCRGRLQDLFEARSPLGVQRFQFHAVLGLVNHGEEADGVAVFELGAVRGGVDVSDLGFESLDGAGICSVNDKSRELLVEEVLQH